MAELGLEPYRADQVAGWIYGRGIDDLERMTDLSAAARERLAGSWRSRALALAATRRSLDGTQKAVLRADDGARVEAVLIPEPGRMTLCVSTQVGCAMGCAFCATAALGRGRNLSTAEIVDQVFLMRSLLPPDERITNVVFMGMGEPLLNLRAVQGAVRVLVDPRGFALAPRRITVSTVGVVPRIGDLLRTAPVNLAVSLHATTDAVRDRLVPLNRRYPLPALLSALRREPALGPRRPVFFEYTLIDGVNDSPEDARRLPRLLAGIPCKLNLIPMNPHADSPFRPPSAASLDAFLEGVAASGLRVTVRRSRGEDIDAACGQLALREVRASSPPARSPMRTRRESA
jgi:23S rRNA (adenine2503-C2)-methyltransferase